VAAVHIGNSVTVRTPVAYSNCTAILAQLWLPYTLVIIAINVRHLAMLYYIRVRQKQILFVQSAQGTATLLHTT